jgi:hypothetical protein
MRIVLFACAESAAVDQATQRLSIFHVLEEISSPVFPAAYPQFTMIVMASREQTEPSAFDLNLRITLSGQEQPLLDGGFQLEFQNRPRARTLAQIAGLPIPSPGVLHFSLSYEERELSAWDVLVTQVPHPTITTQPAGPAGPPQPAA